MHYHSVLYCLHLHSRTVPDDNETFFTEHLQSGRPHRVNLITTDTSFGESTKSGAPRIAANTCELLIARACSPNFAPITSTCTNPPNLCQSAFVLLTARDQEKLRIRNKNNFYIGFLQRTFSHGGLVSFQLNKIRDTYISTFPKYR